MICYGVFLAERSFCVVRMDGVSVLVGNNYAGVVALGRRHERWALVITNRVKIGDREWVGGWRNLAISYHSFANSSVLREAR